MESEDSSSNDSFKSDEQNEKTKTRESSRSNEGLPNIGENESLNMSHQDLSDVSDLESGQSSDEKGKLDKFDANEVKDLREKLDEKKSYSQGLEGSNGYDAKENKTTDEDVLDFEAEEGECNDEKDDIPHFKVCCRLTS